MHSAANVLYHPAMGRWLFNIGIFFFLLSGPVLVFNLKRLFVPLFCGGLGFMVNAFVLLYADQIGPWMAKLTWSDSVAITNVCIQSSIILLSLVVIVLSLQNHRR